MRRIVTLGLVASLLLVPARADDDPAAQPGSDAILVRLESEDDATRDAAEDEWDALTDADQVRLARRALVDPDAPGAIAAARRVSALSLDSDELPRHVRALLRGPDVGLGGCPSSAGASDVPAIWRAVGERTDWLEDLHRVTTADSLPMLLEVAARGADEMRAKALWTIKVECWSTDAHRASVAALFAGELESWPDLTVPRAPREGSGLPPHFETIARCGWGLERHALRVAVVSRVVAWGWLMRWAAEIEPTAADLGFLDDVIALAEEDTEARAWALRHRVRLTGSGAAAWLRGLLADEEGPDCAIELAARLAMQGDRTAWRALLDRDAGAAAQTPLAWECDRAAAIRAAAEGEFDLSVRNRAAWRATWGVDVTDIDLDAVAAAIAGGAGDVGALVAFHARVHPAGVRGDAAATLADALAGLSTQEELDDASVVTDDLAVVLGLLEVRDRAVLLRVLHAWSEADSALREFAFRARVAVGDPVDADRAWDVWRRGGEASIADDDAWIGLHAAPVVAKRLADLAVTTRPRADAALRALLRRAGLGQEATQRVYVEDVTDADIRAAAVAHLREGRLRAALAILAGPDASVDEFIDPTESELRVTRFRRETQQFWHATLLLAVQGDSAATGDVELLLRENRTPIIDDLPYERADFGLRFARQHAERLGHNCCSRFQAVTALRAAFPTIPIANEWTLALQRDIAVGWLDNYESSVAWSALAEGWLPR